MGGRDIRDWPSKPVCSTPVAPHRYTWRRDDGFSYECRRKTIETTPYKAGEVIWVDVGRKALRALILRVECVRGVDGAWKELYIVARETGKGSWAKQWTQAWPGQVQRGYAIAGVATDIPEDEFTRRTANGN